MNRLKFCSHSTRIGLGLEKYRFTFKGNGNSLSRGGGPHSISYPNYLCMSPGMWENVESIGRPRLQVRRQRSMRTGHMKIKRSNASRPILNGKLKRRSRICDVPNQCNYNGDGLHLNYKKILHFSMNLPLLKYRICGAFQACSKAWVYV